MKANTQPDGLWTKDDLDEGRCSKYDVGRSRRSRINLVTSVAGDTVSIYDVESHLRKLGLTEQEIDQDMQARGLRPKKAVLDPKAKFKSDLQSAYEQLGGVAYLRALAVNNPDLFVKCLLQTGVLG